MISRLFVANKPIFISSNRYINRFKKNFNTKKIGFSGILDPFAKGCLIIGTGQYTKLFNYLDKSPKKYRATMWIGVESHSLDLENIYSINESNKISKNKIIGVLESLKGDLIYSPPKFSGKKINGKRAYNMARNGEEFQLKKVSSKIYNISLVNYNHPFITFQTTVSEGTYIRSLSKIISEKLDVRSTLSALTRINEGKFYFDNEKNINPFDYLNIDKNIYLGDSEYLELGKKLNIKNFKIKSDGVYLIESDNFFSILEFKNKIVKYKLNRIQKFIG